MWLTLFSSKAFKQSGRLTKIDIAHLFDPREAARCKGVFWCWSLKYVWQRRKFVYSCKRNRGFYLLALVKCLNSSFLSLRAKFPRIIADKAKWKRQKRFCLKPSLTYFSIVAPSDSRYSATWSCPLEEARWRGVIPMLFCKLIMRTFRPTKRLSTIGSQPYLKHT